MLKHGPKTAFGGNARERACKHPTEHRFTGSALRLTFASHLFSAPVSEAWQPVELDATSIIADRANSKFHHLSGLRRLRYVGRIGYGTSQFPIRQPCPPAAFPRLFGQEHTRDRGARFRQAGPAQLPGPFQAIAEDVAEATSPRTKMLPPACRGGADPCLQVNRGNAVWLRPAIRPAVDCCAITRLRNCSATETACLGLPASETRAIEPFRHRAITR